MPKRTYQPHNKQRKKEHGFIKRNSTKSGKKVLARRRIKGRARLSAQCIISNMLNKKYRFHSRGGVKYVYQKGKTVRNPKMSLVFVKNTRSFTRFAVVVSKKVIKSAVGRNRIRRRVYEALRRNMEYIPKETDYVFVVLKCFWWLICFQYFFLVMLFFVVWIVWFV